MNKSPCHAADQVPLDNAFLVTFLFVLPSSSHTIIAQFCVQRGPGSSAGSQDLEESHYAGVARSGQSQVRM